MHLISESVVIGDLDIYLVVKNSSGNEGYLVIGHFKYIISIRQFRFVLLVVSWRTDL